jgi:hypothetical protein
LQWYSDGILLAVSKLLEDFHRTRFRVDLDAWLQKRLFPKISGGESMKKLLLVVLSLVVLISVVGCAKDTSPEATTTAAQPDAAAKDAAAPKAAADSVSTKPVNEPAPKAPAPPPDPKFTVPQGTKITIFPRDPISTGKNETGETFTGTLAEPLVVNGNTVAEKGTTVQGKIVEAEGSGRVKGRANIRLTLTSIGSAAKSFPIVTKPFAVEAEAQTGRDAKIIGGAAAVGTAIGALTGGKKGALEGAAVGGGAGTGAVLVTKGKEVEFGPETKLSFTLDKPVELPKLR